MIDNYLLDTSVTFGFLNTKDANHQKCRNFFLTHKTDKYFIPLHSRFEIHGSMNRRIRGNAFSGLPGGAKINLTDLPIDKPFYKQCRDKRLFDTFNTLKGGDLIFACIAKISGYILVTCDNDFDCYSAIIKIEKLV